MVPYRWRNTRQEHFHHDYQQTKCHPNDLLKKPVKSTSTVSSSDKVKKVHIKKILTTLSDSEFESLMADLSCLEPETKSKIEEVITTIRDGRKLNDNDIDLIAKLDVKSSAKLSRSCTLL